MKTLSEVLRVLGSREKAITPKTDTLNGLPGAEFNFFPKDISELHA